MKTELAGWGNYPRVETELLRARGEEEIRQQVNDHAQLIARGNGRAYGDSALNAAATLSLLRSDRLIALDAVSGSLICEAGVLLADILQVIVPRGWFTPVTPGTKFVTIGGMIAADVHGKNHHQSGSIRNFVEELTLLLADGSTRICSPTQHADLFAATCGGMGLTGVITRATLKLVPIETAYIQQTTRRTRNLAETMEAFEQGIDVTYSVAWIDCLAQGDALGRSVVYFGEHAPRAALAKGDPLALPHKKARAVPCYLPSFVLNPVSINAFNKLYYARARDGMLLIDYESFFYPLDALHHWNRIYGKRGFVQYQCVLPKAASAAGMQALLERISAAGLGSFLAVLKLLGKGGGYLSFPMEGYTLALDFPATDAVFTLLGALDAIVAEHGGRIYLAKDARMSSSTLRHGYPDLDMFIALRDQVDPAHKFSSLQSQRLSIP